MIQIPVPAESITSLSLSEQTLPPPSKNTIPDNIQEKWIIDKAEKGLELGMESVTIVKSEIPILKPDTKNPTWLQLDSTYSSLEKVLIQLPTEEEVAKLFDEGHETVPIVAGYIRHDEKSAQEKANALLTGIKKDFADLFSSKVVRSEEQRMKDRNGKPEFLVSRAVSLKSRLSLEYLAYTGWLDKVLEELGSDVGSETIETYVNQKYLLALGTVAALVIYSDVESSNTNKKRGETGYDKSGINDTLAYYFTLLRRKAFEGDSINSLTGRLTAEEMEFWDYVRKFIPNDSEFYKYMNSLEQGVESEVSCNEIVHEVIEENFPGYSAELSDPSEDIRGKDIIIKSPEGEEVAFIDVKSWKSLENSSPIVFTLETKGGRILKLDPYQEKEFEKPSFEIYDIGMSEQVSLREEPGIFLRVPGSFYKEGTEEDRVAIKGAIRSDLTLLFQKER